MKVCLLTDTYWPDLNGVAMSVHRLFRGLANQHEVQLICTHNPERLTEDIAHSYLYREAWTLPLPGYEQVRFGLPLNGQLKKLWERERPQVVYIATEGLMGYFAARLAKKMGIATVSGFHTNFHSYSQFYSLGVLQSMIEKYLVHMHNLTNCTVVPTDVQQQELINIGIHNVDVLGRGVDNELFNPSRRNDDLRKSWGANDNTPVIVYVGRIAEEKNLDLTMRAYTAMKTINPELKFVMVGNGPAVDRLSAAYPEIIFAGPRKGTELAEYYASGDMFLFSSLSETYGNVILEAMASGLGVVAFNYAAGKIHIRDGENGLIAECDDEAGFIRQACKLLEEPEHLYQLRFKAAEHAAKNSWQAVVDQFETILRKYSEPMDMGCGQIKAAG